jgi:hypothetical protein
MNTRDLIDGLRRFDDARPPLPAEHWLKLSAGLVLLMGGGRGSIVKRALSIAAGGTLIYKALNGREGLIDTLKRERSKMPQVPQAPGRQTLEYDGTLIASAADSDAAVDLNLDHIGEDAVTSQESQPSLFEKTQPVE